MLAVFTANWRLYEFTRVWVIAGNRKMVYIYVFMAIALLFEWVYGGFVATLGDD